jgi:hypothetical protein
MTIVITLNSELETLLRNRAAQQGQDVNFLASELLAGVLLSEQQELETTIKGIQQGLNDFEEGKYRAFEDFAQEQRQKYNLPLDL